MWQPVIVGVAHYIMMNLDFLGELMKLHQIHV